MVALSAVKPGDTLYDVSREKAGNTTMRRTVVRAVKVIEVAADHVVASWNSNPARRFGERSVRRWRRSPPAKRPDPAGRAVLDREEGEDG